MLEGASQVKPMGLDFGSVGCRSGHLQGLNSNFTQLELKARHSRRLSY